MSIFLAVVFFKAGMAKILSQVRTRGRDVITGAKWLSATDFIVYRLTGVASISAGWCP